MSGSIKYFGEERNISTNMETKFNVLLWDFNQDKLIPYDVLPYFRECYKERKKRYKGYSKRKAYYPDNKYYNVPNTFEEFKEFIKSESIYRFWSRCEYEMIIHGWPVRKNEHKLDVHEQIMMNIDIIADILLKETE